MAPYSSKPDLKKRLGMLSTEVSFDSEMDLFIESADAEIDDRLRPYTAVPLSTVPTTVKHVSSELAFAQFVTRPHATPVSADVVTLAANVRAAALDRLREFVEATHTSAAVAEVGVPLLEDMAPPEER